MSAAWTGQTPLATVLADLLAERAQLLERVAELEAERDDLQQAQVRVFDLERERDELLADLEEAKGAA